MAATGDSTLSYRMDRTEREVEKLDEEKAEKADVDRIAKEVLSLRLSMNRLTMALVSATVGFAASAILLAVQLLGGS